MIPLKQVGHLLRRVFTYKHVLSKLLSLDYGFTYTYRQSSFIVFERVFGKWIEMLQ